MAVSKISPDATPKGHILSPKHIPFDNVLSPHHLSNAAYKELLGEVEQQITRTINKSIILQERKEIIDKLILSESILFLSTNSVSSLLGTQNQVESSLNGGLYCLFAFGIIIGCFSLVLKWVNTKQEKSIENYRTSIKEILEKYGQDAWFMLEKKRMGLPATVLASGFFRGLDDSFNKKHHT